MERSRGPIKPGYHGYPEAKEGPKTTYKNAPASNPVLRGMPLAVAGSACVNRTLTWRYTNTSEALQISAFSPASYGATQASILYES